ncbi:ribonuclease HII [Ornithinimicrobium sp. CNJ-824]|uniref:ribonuclease HII n=1 Tax=Ornithinimicrobium sp. CNJ-824 TaxID=1904966 RepID=UPI000964EDF4|nr:ribonuclease HII [Ornithinimicrobium sp. CNJ-824]OLT21000.1 ribonuclease HII [Ornithinimicrobium sp. CNJ-824]
MTSTTARPRRGAGTSGRPSLRVERSLHREGYAVLAGMDEVGRGALAGPVTVGVVAVDPLCRSAPPGVRDSKLLTPAARERLVPAIRRWCVAWGVGHATAQEIDAVGIMSALRLAGERALAQLLTGVDLVLLDGSHDWLTDPGRDGLLGLLDDRPAPPPVRTMVKADLRCSSVAAASVLAKVERDAMMVQMAEEHPAYGWDHNKGYAARDHQEALRLLGPCAQHRRTWRLAGSDLDEGSAR